MASIAVLLGACGRIGFEPGAPTDASGDSIDGTGDASSTACKGGLAPTCGPTRTASCCATAVVPGGTYARSFDMAADAMFPSNTFTATLADYRLDLYEITVGRFRQFVDAGMGTQANPPAAGAGAHPNIANSGWNPAWSSLLPANTGALTTAIQCNATLQTFTVGPGANENRPMNCITWYEAAAFCAWDGGYLPTEAQWDYAAAGGSEQRAYPWSSPPDSLVIDGTRASYSDGTDCVGDGLPGCALTDLGVVGSKPAGDGRWGHADLGGNVWEWTLDQYATPYLINPCNDCADLTATGGRAVRGGYLSAPVIYIRSASRFGNGEMFRSATQGARCARPL